MGHEPGRAIGTNCQFSLKLNCRDAFLGRANHINGKNPFSQRHVGIVKDRADGDGILIATITAMIEMALFPSLAIGLETKNAPAVTLWTA